MTYIYISSYNLDNIDNYSEKYNEYYSEYFYCRMYILLNQNMIEIVKMKIDVLWIKCFKYFYVMRILKDSYKLILVEMQNIV